MCVCVCAVSRLVQTGNDDVAIGTNVLSQLHGLVLFIHVPDRVCRLAAANRPATHLTLPPELRKETLTVSDVYICFERI